METVRTETSQKLAYELFKDIEKDDMEYIYRGNFSSSIVAGILALAKTNLEKSEDTAKLTSRIYFIMGEGLQNITRHQELPENITPEENSIFVINKKKNKYYITTGNIIEKQNIEPLTQKLETINGMTREELRVYGRDVRNTTGFSEKGGAGIGLIEMAKRSGNKLFYSFKELSETHSFFYLNTEIPTLNKEGNLVESDFQFSTDSISELHDSLNLLNITLFFKGAFDQENLLNLLSIFEGQMSNTKTSIKIYNIMVEMLQNIVKHASNYGEDKVWKPGIFFITENNDQYILTAGNYIKNKNAKAIENKIEFVNSLKPERLIDYYNKILLEVEVDNPITTGLGIIDIRRKSGNLINYNFRTVDENYTFFTLQTLIKKR